MSQSYDRNTFVWRGGETHSRGAMGDQTVKDS